MSYVKSFMPAYEETLNPAVSTNCCRQKEIDWFKINSQFDEPFSLPGLAGDYNISYETLEDHICGAQKRHEAYTGA